MAYDYSAARQALWKVIVVWHDADKTKYPWVYSTSQGVLIDKLSLFNQELTTKEGAENYVKAFDSWNKFPVNESGKDITTLEEFAKAYCCDKEWASTMYNCNKSAQDLEDLKKKAEEQINKVVTIVKTEIDKPKVPKEKTVNDVVNGSDCLKYGDKGSMVCQLQGLLVNWGLLSTVDMKECEFGEKTWTAVKNFQKKKGIAPSGTVCANTWMKLQEDPHPSATPTPTPTPTPVGDTQYRYNPIKKIRI